MRQRSTGTSASGETLSHFISHYLSFGQPWFLWTEMPMQFKQIESALCLSIILHIQVLKKPLLTIMVKLD